MQNQRIVLLELTTADGLTGYGEATTIGGLTYSDESPESIALTLETYFAPLLIGADVSRTGAIRQSVRSAIVGNHFSKCAVETALLDLAGKRVGLPISELLGGRVRERLPVLWTLASGDTQTDIEEAKAMIAARRHNAFKLKIGKRNWREDVAHVTEIKAALGDDISVRVDVNQAWSSATAGAAVAALTEAGIDLVEQPLPGTARRAAKALRRSGGAAIMADEALRGGVAAARDLAADEAADVFALKIGQCGGLLETRDVAAIAAASGIALYGGTMLEGDIGTIASAHVFSTLPSLEWGTELFGPLLLTESLSDTPLDYADFELGVPTGPGLGIAPNKAALQEYSEMPPTSVSD